LNWTGKRVLVTGAGGFIGSHLTERLVELGATTRALVHYNALGTWGWLNHSPVRNEIEVVAGDVTDRDSVRRVLRRTERVFHLAALIAIPYSYQAPVSYVRTNVEGTLNVLQAAHEGGAELVVHTSTSEVYGTAQYVPIDEAHPLRGQSPYAASKIGADKMAEAYHLSFGLPVVPVRPFNTFGPRQSTRAIVPTIIAQGLAGSVVRLGNLHPSRDLTFVSDTVEGLVRAATVPEAIGKTVNLGSGCEISVGDLVDLIAGLIGQPMSISSEPERARPRDSEVDRLRADSALARQLLHWEPAVSLKDGLGRTIEWMQAHPETYLSGAYVV